MSGFVHPNIPRPYEVGALGAYSCSLKTGTMAAGLAGSAPIWSFRYTGTNLCLVTRVMIGVGDQTTAFAATHYDFQLFFARSFSASDTNGVAATLTGNNCKLRTSHGTTAVGDIRISDTATITAGTRTLDSQPIARQVGGTPATAGLQVNGSDDYLWDCKGTSDQPVIIANNEGLVIQAVVPATGTWVAGITVQWYEVVSV